VATTTTPQAGLTRATHPPFAARTACSNHVPQFQVLPPQAEVTRDFARCLVATAAPPPAPHAPGAAAPPPPPSPAAPPDGVVAGFVVGWLVAGELQVLELAVHPDHRRKGLGAALLARLMADCG
jgi:ribosomal protein S18 acetylase RimI-like enzyme